MASPPVKYIVEDECWDEGQVEIAIDEKDVHGIETVVEARPSSSKSHNKEWIKTVPAQSIKTAPVPRAKLRPASDVLNRLRWDPTLEAEDFLIGYDDRFLGAQEMPLHAWKSEHTDEEFIPQHRIIYFKRVSDGERVWDRETRLDRVFGSGRTSDT